MEMYVFATACVLEAVVMGSLVLTSVKRVAEVF